MSLDPTHEEATRIRAWINWAYDRAKAEAARWDLAASPPADHSDQRISDPP